MGGFSFEFIGCCSSSEGEGATDRDEVCEDVVAVLEVLVRRDEAEAEVASCDVGREAARRMSMVLMKSSFIYLHGTGHIDKG